MSRHLPISGSLSEIDFASILARLLEQGLEGRLKVAAPQFTKTLWLRGGRIVFAQSSHADDSLGSRLLRLGVIDEAQMEKARRRMQKSRRRLGRVLMEMGLLTPERLWNEVGGQLRDIAFSLFALRSGRYEISALPPEARENIHIDLPLAEAILEGVRLLQDEEFVESRFGPGLTLFSSPDGALGAVALKAHESHVLSLADHGAPLEEIVASSELLRFDTLKILYALRVLGLVSDCRCAERSPPPHPRPPPPTTVATFEEALQHYNARFEYIFRVLSKEIGPVAHTILTDAVAGVLDSIAPCFQGLKLLADGRLEEKSLLKGVWYEDFAAAGGGFLRGLDEILYAEIYAVKRHLGKEHESLILQWMRQPGN